MSSHCKIVSSCVFFHKKKKNTAVSIYDNNYTNGFV